MPLGALPSSSSILGNTPGASGQRRQRRPQGGALSQPPTDQQQPQAAPQQPQTFAQMQQSGQARPAPPRSPAFQPPLTARPGQPAGPSSSQGLQSPLQQSLRQSLANPNPYNSNTVQQINAGLTGQINQDYGAQRKHLEEDLARRGLSASTIGGGYYGDLAGQQDQALATMRAGLIQQSANAELQGRSSAQGAAQSNINAANQQGLSEQQLELSRQLGLGNLNLQQGSLTGNLNGQSTLGAQQLAQSGSQFNRQQQLAEQMGFGNLGLGQGQLALAQTGQAQQYGLSRDQLALQQQLGVGNLGISQGQLDLARTGQAQDYGLAKNAQNIQQQQFGQTFGLSQQQQDLARTLGLGNLDVSRQQLAQQGSQFGQDLALRSKQNDQQYGLQSQAQTDARQQFAQQLAQQFGIATMSDKTANRGIDANASQQQLDYLLRLAGITGIGGLGGTSGGSSSNPYGIGAGGNGTQGYGNYTGNTAGNGAVGPDGKPYIGAASSNGTGVFDQINNQVYQNNRPTNYQTVNFGGQQYTPQQFEQLKQQHPELFGAHNPQAAQYYSPNAPDDAQIAFNQNRSNLARNVQTPPSGGDALDQWYSQYGMQGPRYGTVNGTTIDYAQQALQGILTPNQAGGGPSDAMLHQYGITPEIRDMLTAAQSASNQRYQYGTQHGGFDMGANNPNANPWYLYNRPAGT